MSRNRKSHTNCGASAAPIFGALLFLLTLDQHISAATHRFDHVEFKSFPGGNTAVHGLSNTSFVAGASGGIGFDMRQAFLSDATGQLAPLAGLQLQHSVGLVVNNAGQVAGRGCTGPQFCSTPTAFRFTPSIGMQEIAGLPGHIGEVTDINEQGDVVGAWKSDGPETTNSAFLFTDKIGLLDLGHLGGGSSQAVAINDSQQVIGTSRYGILPSHTHAFLWENGVMTDLGVGPFGGVQSQAADINNAGTVVGSALDASFNSHAFIYTAATGMQPLPLPKAAVHSAAMQINEAGMVLAGFTRTDESSGMVVVHPDGTFNEIPLLEGFQAGSAIAMNNLGHVIGGNILVQGSEEIVAAFYWSLETGTISLDGHIISDMPWTIFNPVAINDNDEILVRTFDANSIERSALLRPALDGDVNGDRVINVDDLLRVINAWGQCSPPVLNVCAPDFDNNGVINVDDLLTVINNWN